jgi:hypothetical protein
MHASSCSAPDACQLLALPLQNLEFEQRKLEMRTERAWLCQQLRRSLLVVWALEWLGQ